jgi:hypothetical protein
MKHGRPPTDIELNDELQVIRQRQFNWQQFWFSGPEIRRCLPIITAENLKKRGQAGAAKRWSKKNEKTA